MTVEQMRVAIAKAYPGRRWENKVNDMPEGQVVTVYLRLMANKQL